MGFRFCQQLDKSQTDVTYLWQVKANPELNYSQGLDSLCAPFILLHLDHPHRALESLHLFVERNMTSLLRAGVHLAPHTFAELISRRVLPDHAKNAFRGVENHRYECGLSVV